MSKNVTLVGIAGGSGSGKTTFSHRVSKICHHQIAVISQDSYYLAFDDQPKVIFGGKEQANFDHPDSFDWGLFHQQLISLKSGEHVEVPIYDFVTNSRTDANIKVQGPTVIIVEGIFTLFKKEIRDLFDIKVFIGVESDIRFIRRLHRDVEQRGRSLESVIQQYYATVRPMYKKFLEPQSQYADFIVGEENQKAADILAAKLLPLITGSSSCEK